MLWCSKHKEVTLIIIQISTNRLFNCLNELILFICNSFQPFPHQSELGIINRFIKPPDDFDDLYSLKLITSQSTSSHLFFGSYPDNYLGCSSGLVFTYKNTYL